MTDTLPPLMTDATVVHVYKTKVWIEDDIMGSRHVMLQHETCEPFTYCTFHYNWAYTSNAGTHAAATAMALSLGATEPVEHRIRELKWTKQDEAIAQVVTDAIAAEREACAKLCDEEAEAAWGCTEEQCTAEHLANAIRSRGHPPQASNEPELDL